MVQIRPQSFSLSWSQQDRHTHTQTNAEKNIRPAFTGRTRRSQHSQECHDPRRRCLCHSCSEMGPPRQGHNYDWKVEGNQGLVPTPGRLPQSPATGGADVGCWRGLALSLWGPKYHPRKIFKNSDAKSCIMVITTPISELPIYRTCISKQTSMSRAKSVPKFQLLGPGWAPDCWDRKQLWKLWNNTCCDISCFLKTTAKKLGDGSTLFVLQPKSWGSVFPGPYGCCAYDPRTENWRSAAASVDGSDAGRTRCCRMACAAGHCSRENQV